MVREMLSFSAMVLAVESSTDKLITAGTKVVGWARFSRELGGILSLGTITTSLPLGLEEVGIFTTGVLATGVLGSGITSRAPSCLICRRFPQEALSAMTAATAPSPETTGWLIALTAVDIVIDQAEVILWKKWLTIVIG